MSWAWAGAAAAAFFAVQASAEDFQITIENLSPNVLTPAPFISHDATFDLFDEGAPASSELEQLAEDGVTSGVTGLAAAAGVAVADWDVAGGAPIGPGGSATITVSADLSRPYLSFASMLAVTNDAFIGWAVGDGALDLFPGGTPYAGSITIGPDGVWDAGTERNDELAANVPALGGSGGLDEGGVISRPHPGITGDADIPLSRDWTGGDVARITIVPEPTSLGLFGMVALGGLMLRRR